jgi:RNase P/RNase MRP subunit p29
MGEQRMESVSNETANIVAYLKTGEESANVLKKREVLSFREKEFYGCI